MPVQLSAPNPSQIFPIPGVNIGIAQAGVKRPGKDDLTIFLLDEGVSIGGVFTKNRFKAAPVQICESILNAVTPCVRALVINTGNANAGTGESGKAHAQMVCKATADLLSLEADQVLPFSTGVIMEPLPFQKIINALQSWRGRALLFVCYQKRDKRCMDKGGLQHHDDRYGCKSI